MPFKFHEPRRHRIPKAQYRVRNWPDYDRGLVRRRDVRVWVSQEAIDGWEAACRTTPGGQQRCLWHPQARRPEIDLYTPIEVRVAPNVQVETAVNIPV